MNNISIKEKFNPNIKTALYSNFSNAYEAVQEIIDNSVSNRIRGHKMQVKVFFMEKSKKWLSEPRAGMPPEEWNSEIDVQLNKATKLVSEFQNPATTLEEHSTKIWAFGKERPKGEDMLTRIYIGVDPRHASDAFQALLEEFGNQGI